MDPKELNLHVLETLPHPSGTQWNEVICRPFRHAKAQFVMPSDANNADERCRIAHVLHDHALLLHQCTDVCGVPEPNQSGQTMTSVFPPYINVDYMLDSHSRSSSRSGDMSTNAFMENHNDMNV